MDKVLTLGFQSIESPHTIKKCSTEEKVLILVSTHCTQFESQN